MQNGTIIHTYTRAQALSDGVLKDVTKLAKEAGFKVPVAITNAVDNLISNHPKLTGGVWNLFKQDYDGRLWDVLWMAYANAANNPQKSILKYEVILPHYELMQNADGIEKHMLKYKATLKVIVNGGDNGEPVITIMLPDED